MFEQSTLLNTPRRWWTTCAGLGAEALAVAAMLLVPIIWPQAIPRVAYLTALAPPGPPPAPAHRGNTVRPQHHAPSTRIFHTAALTAPTAAPVHAALIVDQSPEIGNFGVPGGVENGVEGSFPTGVLGSVVAELRPPPIERPQPAHPLVPTTPAPVQRIIPGGNVRLAEPIFRPEPVYPPMARSMRVSGVVELLGVIGTDGHIKELRISRGHPLLARAALEAVARWIYKPTLLNGVPVEVEAPITVTFTLN